MQNWITQQRNEFEAMLPNYLPNSNDTLHQAMHYAVCNGGKRLRPLLVYAAGLSLNAPIPALHPAAVAIELIHCYSLVHDDLPAMDDDDLRRGQPSCHKQFDDATAILVGDALQSMAFEVLTQDQLPNQVAIISTLAKASGAFGMTRGQALDIEATNKASTIAEIQEIHKLKTGCLFQAALKMGGLIANRSIEKLNTLDNIAKALGLAFQIRDDILDAEKSTDELGKTAGKDMAQNKSTYVTLLGIEKAKLDLKAQLDQARQQTLLLDNPKPILDILDQLT